MKKSNQKKHHNLVELDKLEGSHYFKKMKTQQQRKANNALDKVLRQKDFSKALHDDEDFYYNY